MLKMCKRRVSKRKRKRIWVFESGPTCGQVARFINRILVFDPHNSLGCACAEWLKVLHGVYKLQLGRVVVRVLHGAYHYCNWAKHVIHNCNWTDSAQVPSQARSETVKLPAFPPWCLWMRRHRILNGEFVQVS